MADNPADDNNTDKTASKTAPTKKAAPKVAAKKAAPKKVAATKTAQAKTTAKPRTVAAKKTATPRKTAASRPKTSTVKNDAAKATSAPSSAAKTVSAKGVAPKASANAAATEQAPADTAASRATAPTSSTASASERPDDARFEKTNTTHDKAHDSSFDGAQIMEDLKGRNWGKILSRALLMFFFGVLGTFSLYVAFFLAVAQVVFNIFAGSPNAQLTNIMGQLSGYIRDVLAYLSFASDELPFPFGKDVPPAGDA